MVLPVKVREEIESYKLVLGASFRLEMPGGSLE